MSLCFVHTQSFDVNEGADQNLGPESTGHLKKVVVLYDNHTLLNSNKRTT